jgi:hypothetical protein
MKSSLLQTLRAGPPPPKVALLPDGLFFTRAVPVAAGATAAEAASQVELALEAISPFPLAQLYYGWFWVPGADHALVFASYRRRFTPDQSSGWVEAELVLPAFAAILGSHVQPATTVILTSPEGLTAVHWETGPVPATVLFRPITPPLGEPSAEDLAKADEERARLREALIRDVGGSKTVLDLTAPPVADRAMSDRETVFRTGDFVSRLPAAVVAAIDVRDKADLAQRRSARRRDVILWRVALGCAAALLIFALGEFALIGGKAWQKVRVATVNGQQPRVEKIMEAQAFASQIDEIVTKRLLPMEMMTQLVGVNHEILPDGILFKRVITDPKDGIYSLRVEASATNPALISVYQASLENLHLFDNVTVTVGNTSSSLSLFTLSVTFKPGAVKPAPSA